CGVPGLKPQGFHLTHYKSLPQAIGQGDIKRARALVLTVANRYGFSKDVQALMKAGIDVNARDDRGQTLLISVAMWGENKQIDPDLVKTLILAGVDVNAKDNYGKNALFYAARASNAAVRKALLQPDTDGDLKTKKSTNQ
ncbi:ankyrin repeat domain-containing protein, partial [Brasilonema bromeliae]